MINFSYFVHMVQGEGQIYYFLAHMDVQSFHLEFAEKTFSLMNYPDNFVENTLCARTHTHTHSHSITQIHVDFFALFPVLLESFPY